MLHERNGWFFTSAISAVAYRAATEQAARNTGTHY